MSHAELLQKNQDLRIFQANLFFKTPFPFLRPSKLRIPSVNTKFICRQNMPVHSRYFIKLYEKWSFLLPSLPSLWVNFLKNMITLWNTRRWWSYTSVTTILPSALLNWLSSPILDLLQYGRVLFFYCEYTSLGKFTFIRLVLARHKFSEVVSFNFSTIQSHERSESGYEFQCFVLEMVSKNFLKTTQNLKRPNICVIQVGGEFSRGPMPKIVSSILSLPYEKPK